MSRETKQKIIGAAIQLFNDQGLANVRLKQIATATGISVGNLAYHYKNKDAIVSEVYGVVFEEFSTILANFLIEPNLPDFNRQLERYFQFFNQYHFYLIDLFEIERSFPAINRQWQKHVGKMLLQIRKRLDFWAKKGLLQAEPATGRYDLLTNNIWMSIVFWIPQQILTGQHLDLKRFKMAVWSQILPYLSPAGLEQYYALIDPILKDTADQ